MFNYELHPKLVHLVLTGQDEEGLEFVGSLDKWYKAGRMEEEMSGVV